MTDTRDKRSAAIHVALPWRGMLPVPDNAINQADRQHTALMYRGILAGAAAPSVAAPKNRGFTVNVARLLRSSR